MAVGFNIPLFLFLQSLIFHLSAYKPTGFSRELSKEFKLAPHSPRAPLVITLTNPNFEWQDIWYAVQFVVCYLRAIKGFYRCKYPDWRSKTLAISQGT